MTAAELCLLILIALVFYTYIGYALLLWLLLKIRSFLGFQKKQKKEESEEFAFAPVTLVIPAYNEEDFIREKIVNTLTLDYPSELLRVIFVTDGSTDNTSAIIAQYPRFLLMHTNERKGKIAAMNRVMKTVNSPFVVFCDANTLLNRDAIKEISRHYANSEVGGVAGEKKVIDSEKNNIAGAGEGLYWRYESALKQLDSDFYTVVGAAGELFSFRTALYEEIEEDTLLDDFVISLRICQKGYRVVYESKAYAVEKPSANIKEEQKRKIRISAGAFQSIIRLKALLNIFKYPTLAFQYISHRVLRWAVCPFLLPLIFLLNGFLLIDGHLFYKIIFVLQSGFYFLAFTGWLLTKSGRKARLLNFPYYFVFMNVSLYFGLFRFLKGNQTVIWEKAKRDK